MVEHQVTLDENLHADKLITTEIHHTKRPESTETQIKTGQRSFAFRGATCWNKLPKDMKEVADYRIFFLNDFHYFTTHN